MKEIFQKIGIWFLKIYWCFSFCALGICDDASCLEIFAVIVNFGTISLLLRKVPLEGDDRA